jgi:hypothetical protein
MLAAAAAGEDDDHAAAAATASEGVVVQGLGPVFPTKSPSEALEAAFPFAPATATRQATPAADSAAAVQQQQQHRAPAAAAVGARVGPVTADGLVVSEVGVFMGNRMFKTPFSSWASWLKDAGRCEMASMLVCCYDD